MVDRSLLHNPCQTSRFHEKSIKDAETKEDRTSINHYGRHGETQHTASSPILVTNIGG
jgi:hypothetical protein